jgi:hypothetical protein
VNPAGLLATADLVKGKTIGIDATTLQANAELRSIVRRDTGESDSDSAYHRSDIAMDAQELLNQQEWEQSDNWTGWLGIYRGARDMRLWVPKRNPDHGWTLNFAHRAAWWSLLGLFSVPLGFVVLFLFLRVFR